MEQELRSEKRAEDLAGGTEFRSQAGRVSMMAQAGLRRWREVEGRPVQGNSPNDRILRGPDCNRPKRVCADSFPATPQPLPKTQTITGRRFLRQGGIYRSDVVLKTI